MFLYTCTHQPNGQNTCRHIMFLPSVTRYAFYIQTLHFFTFEFPFLHSDNTFIKVSLGLGTKNASFGLGKDHVLVVVLYFCKPWICTNLPHFFVCRNVQCHDCTLATVLHSLTNKTRFSFQITIKHDAASKRQYDTDDNKGQMDTNLCRLKL